MPGWDRGLVRMDLVICDRVAARRMPGEKRLFVLDVIAEESIAASKVWFSGSLPISDLNAINWSSPQNPRFKYSATSVHDGSPDHKPL
jgi:hypothetical protein